MISSKILQEKYEEMKSLGKKEDFIDEKKLGGIKLFIGSKPKLILFSVSLDADVVYIGSNE